MLAAVTPTDEQAFDPAAFLAEHGTLFLLGTAAGAGAAASLVAALVEDIVETARHTAAASPRARLDPPLLLALDEIGTLAPLPSLPALMSDGGGSGITTLAVLQSLSQARDKWGEQQAGTLWDAAIVKLILGGGSHARDLADLSALIGDRDEPTHTIARDATGTRSSSTSTRRVPVLDPSRLRTLPFGTGGPAAAHRPTDRAEPAPVDHPGRRARADPSPSRRRNPAAHHRRNRTAADDPQLCPTARRARRSQSRGRWLGPDRHPRRVHTQDRLAHPSPGMPSHRDPQPAARRS